MMLRISGGCRVNNFVSRLEFSAAWLKQLRRQGRTELGRHILKAVQDSTFGASLESIVLKTAMRGSLLLAVG
jgi:hypothetical protein